MPLMLVAIDAGEIVGTAQLKFREMKIYPEKEHWLGGVYVAESARKQGIAKILVESIEAEARRFAVKTLYLQTEYLDGGLYATLGWQAVEQVNYRGVDVLVMHKHL